METMVMIHRQCSNSIVSLTHSVASCLSVFVQIVYIEQTSIVRLFVPNESEKKFSNRIECDGARLTRPENAFGIRVPAEIDCRTATPVLESWHKLEGCWSQPALRSNSGPPRPLSSQHSRVKFHQI
ncbi:hypothetical protein ANTRET_LOCUS3396 [Anthophora retusa]